MLRGRLTGAVIWVWDARDAQPERPVRPIRPPPVHPPGSRSEAWLRSATPLLQPLFSKREPKRLAVG